MTTTTTRQGLPLLPAYRGVTVELTPRYGQHWYRVDGETELLPSVTSILKIIDKSGPLMNWSRKLVIDRAREELKGFVSDRSYPRHPSDEEIENALAKAKAAPDKVRDESAELGTLAHECINEILSGREPEVPDEVRPAVYGAIDWSSEMGLEVVATESRIWHPVHRYAGTVDFIGRDPEGRLVVADWKRSKGLYPEHAYQGAAYAKAVNHLHGGASRAYVVRLPLHQGDRYEFHEVDIEPAFQAYLAAQALWWATKEEAWQ